MTTKKYDTSVAGIVEWLKIERQACEEFIETELTKDPAKHPFFRGYREGLDAAIRMLTGGEWLSLFRNADEE